jgi:hypothetical protein
MVRPIHLILVTVATLAIFSDPVRSQEIRTASEASLDTLEGRNVRDDWDVFFPEDSQKTVSEDFGYPFEQMSRYDAEFRAFGEEVKVDVEDEQRESYPLFDSPAQSSDVGDNEKVRFLLELDRWNRR